MAGRCEECGTDVDMPFDCKFCEGRYCSRHRIPEKHDCRGLVTHKERLREEGRLMHQPGKASEPTTPTTSSAGGLGGAASGYVDAAMRFLEGRAALVFLGIMVGVFFLEQIVSSYSVSLFETLFVLDPGFYRKPWTLVTSVFAHGGTGHLLANGIVLFFFGPTLERLIGTRRFTGLFLGAGVAAGLAQVVVFSYLLPLAGFAGSQAGVVGASGAIMGVLGTLTLLAPNITVLLFFVVPAPLWLVTIGYALYDLGGIFVGGGNVAHLAHLAGLGIGLWFGWKLKGQGLARQLRQGGFGGGGLGGGGSGGGGVQVVQRRR
jgi:membrane associated rhomboid family serine protease